MGTHIEASLRRPAGPDNAQVEFVVGTDVPLHQDRLYQDRLVKMGWRPEAEPGAFTRHLGPAADIEAIFVPFIRWRQRSSAR